MKLRPPIEMYESLDDEIEQHLNKFRKETKTKKRSKPDDHSLQEKKRK